eukprot:CAMPEP_0168314070 /NCGR_PEP_ID=MMETSP0210-20121227/6139_1 /TAXON_ID=40633 /ORGANISM="Condylostoma magnum, Strain COL2" /LENGTH=110 /DNA_ID=CAMNT_0008278391 /DNA_START=2552 /DNA_END=2884 /DNA_ORIENTATION=+
MPAVTDLRCQDLKDRHWDQIRETLKTDIDVLDPEFTLKSLIDMRVNDKKDDLAEIALKAKKEAELEKQLKEVTDSWEGEELKTNEIKEKDIFILTGVEDIITKLEDTHLC